MNDKKKNEIVGVSCPNCFETSFKVAFDLTKGSIKLQCLDCHDIMEFNDE